MAPNGANGQLAVEGQYVDGQRDGRWNYFDPDGKPVNEENWMMGEQVESETVD
ncbi:MAG: hypothetical protein R3E58_14170 [Phycisphaerae bacterium]